MTGQHHLHENVWIVCAGNNLTDRAIVNQIGTAMQSRVIHIEMGVDFNEWLEDVAIPQKYDERIIAYLSANQTHLMDFDPEHTNKTFRCPRTWEFVNALVTTGEPGVIPEEDTVLIGGAITPGGATSFVQFTAVYKEMIPLATILNAPNTTMLPSKPELKWALTTSLATNCTLDNASKIFDYMKRMDFTFRVVFYQMVVKYLPKLNGTPMWTQAAIDLGKYTR